ncbi:hypothetical protein [Yinghuangia soli]|uniref:NlpC/P60 domain-containing protein n=1 Tax=Yinghuangia soli TaxID=2908204 RepID=A0AA41PVV8_9ACTN|nr:hypothetical protein [Yinghuangia soli]MCF2526683.1 hypothetical protein [Yinghuangia soli]
MNPSVRIDPHVLADLALRFEDAVPGLDAAQRALRDAAADPDVAAGRSLSPATWAAATAAIGAALDDVAHVRSVVASTPGLLRACAAGYTSGDKLGAELFAAIAAGAGGSAPLRLSELPATPPPEPHTGPAVVRADNAPVGIPPFRIDRFGSPAIELAARVAGVKVPDSSPEPSRSSAAPRPQPRATAVPTSAATARTSSRSPAAAASGPPRAAMSGDARRADIIRRAKRWADLGLGYSMSGTFEGYRTDCSGLVSMAWGLPAPGLTTDTMDQVAHRIGKEDLLPGDVLVNTAPGAAGHTLIFAGWTDATHTRYFAYEESGGKGAHFGTVPYPYWPGHGTFHPYRLDALGD